MPIDLSHTNWVMWALALGALAIGWTLLRVVLRLTMRIFTLGCVGLLILVGIIWVAAYLGR